MLPDALNVPGSNEGTWKRISRSCVGTDVVMEEAMGTKRTTQHTAGHSKLQYIYIYIYIFVSQIGNENNKILGEAGS